MISIVVYGRNDAHGYNLHKRAALGINCMAEILSHATDEILFVDYNTPDDYPTFPEAIADTLTSNAIARLRVLRVRPAIHDRVKARTHLKAVEPVARNVAVRRSNPANRWILSTNSDMILAPREPWTSLDEIVGDLPNGFYHIPRFEVPESMWEGFDRAEPLRVIDRIRSLGRTMALNEVIFSVDFIKYDGPGDFQLIARDDLFRIHGFNEEMLLGWHVDSNIAKRLHLIYGAVGDLADRIRGYHCDHTRQATPSHERPWLANDWGAFVEDVIEPALPRQAESWGCAGDDIEEISLSRSAHQVYVESLDAVLGDGDVEPLPVRYTPESFDQSGYDPRHVVPFLMDLFSALPRVWNVAWLGAGRDVFELFCGLWERMGFRGHVLFDDQSASLLAEPRAFVKRVSAAVFEQQANVFVFAFGASSSELSDPLKAHGSGWRLLDDVTDACVSRRLIDVAARERARIAQGSAPRRFICVNAVHNRYEALVRREIAAAVTPFATRLRHGFVVPGALRQPPDADDALPAAAWIDEAVDVLEHAVAGPGGRRTEKEIVAPFGQRGYVLQSVPYERLFPGEYELVIQLRPRSPLTLLACLRPVIVEIVGGDGYLAREQLSYVLRRRLHVRFTVPIERRDGLSGVEVRLFRGRFADFVVTGLQLWKRNRHSPRAVAGIKGASE